LGVVLYLFHDVEAITWLVVLDDEPDDHSGLAITTTVNRPHFTQGILLLMSADGKVPGNTNSEL